jgi:NAD(P)-dependent dehydrogenase (short-subunit alcohol dehydrogenase family)
MDRFRLDGKVAVITGASKNIGAAISRGFAEAGADLLLVARTLAPLEAVAEEVAGSTGRRVEVFAADVATQGEAIAARAFEAFGRVDVLVNNAMAFGATGPILDIERADFQQAFDVNVFGVLDLTRPIARMMLERGEGSIINLLSAAGFAPVPTASPYSVTKAALHMLTRSLAKELAPTVRVNGLCPGTMTVDGVPRSEAQRKYTPMLRGSKAEEIIGAALYLASSASSYSTGDVVFVNGGLTNLWGFSMEGVMADPTYGRGTLS